MKSTTFLPLLTAILLTGLPTFAQPTSNQQTENLLLLAKIWGFLKYYHPAIATGKVNWDTELLHFLPVYRRLTHQKERNDSLLAWIDRQGTITPCDSCEATPPKDARLKPDFSWMDDAGLSHPLRDRLHYIVRNRNTKPNYYVQCQTSEDVTIPLFQNEKFNYSISYPDTSYGMLCLFRFWNAIEYWYPYKYNLQTSWDDVFRNFIPRMALEPNLLQYAHDTEELLTRIEDSHGVLVWTRDKEIHGSYMLPFTVKFAGKWMVTSLLNDSLATTAGIRIGDILDSMDGKPMAAIVRELSACCPASNTASLMNRLSQKIIQTPLPQSPLTITRDNRSIPILTNNFKPLLSGLIDGNPAWFPYPKDSAFCRLPGNIVYLNMGRLNRKDSALFKEMIRQSTGLVIDDRQNADEMHGTNAADIVGEMILPPNTPFVRFSSVQSSFPGVFRLGQSSDMGIPAPAKPYPGKIAILINENTTSVGEFISMAYKTSPHAILIGTPTAGADGNVNYLWLPGSGVAQFTALGVYYPDGKETQRTGLQPDITVKETLADYRQKRDVQLEKALLYLTHN